MVKVKLEGLKIARSRGKYYVYVRATGKALLKGFEGDKAALLKRLAMPDMIGAYNVQRKRDPKTYPERTLGWLVHWFLNECPEYAAMSDATKFDYKAALDYLEPEYDCPLSEITQASLYQVRDTCAEKKWPTFADKVITALSSMFKHGTKRGKMAGNPALGVENIHKADPNANREWRPEEFAAAFAAAPLKHQIIMMIARHIGYRGQSISRLQWSSYQPDPVYGKCFRTTHKKNDEMHWLPAPPELQAFLDGLERTSLHIATKHNGTPWRDEEQMQKQFSNWLSSLRRKKIVGEGVTLHGLRVTYAAGIKRAAFERGDLVDDSGVAAALGDRDARMGTHYTRHVENEIKVIQAFGRPPKKKRK